MNKALEKFLNFIVSPDSISDIDGYIPNRKVSDNNLVLEMGYINGGTYIKGIAYGDSVKVLYNYHQNQHGFYVEHDGKQLAIPITLLNLYTFFDQGRFLEGTRYKDGTLPKFKKRASAEMNWYIWEAIIMEVDTLRRNNNLPKTLNDEVSEICRLTRESGSFNEDLRTRACDVEYAVEQFRKELDEYHDKENKERI